MSNSARYERGELIERNFPIKVMNFVNSKKLFPHWHERIEFIYMLRGEARFEIDRVEIFASEGELIVANSGEIHAFNAECGIDYICVVLYPDFWNDVDIGNELIENHIAPDEQIKEIFLRLRALRDKKDEITKLEIKSETYRLFAYLLRNYKASARFESGAVGNDIKRLKKVIEYVADNYKEDISVKTLADISFCTVGHFCRFFKASMGRSATRYINEYRIHKAKKLLTSTDMSISEVSSEVGFGDMNYFSRVFLDIEGVRPLSYKKSIDSNKFTRADTV